MSVRLRICCGVAEAGGIAEWTALRARPPATLTASPGWLNAAALTVDRGSRHHLVTVRDDERLVGLMALTADEDDQGTHVRFAGSPNNDLCDVLARPGHEGLVAELVAAEIAHCVARGWSVSLGCVDPEGLLYTVLGDTDLLSWRADVPAPTVNLLGPWREAISARRRSQWDRRMRRLKEVGTVELRRLEGDQLRRQLPSFLALRQARRAAKGHDDTPPTAFLKLVVNELAPTGHCILMELLVNGDPVAADLYLTDPPVALMWLRGLDPRWQRFPCGHLLLRASAEAFSEAGFDTLDLGRGDEPYKAYFGAHLRVLLHGSAEPRAPGGRD